MWIPLGGTVPSCERVEDGHERVLRLLRVAVGSVRRRGREGAAAGARQPAAVGEVGGFRRADRLLEEIRCAARVAVGRNAERGELVEEALAVAVEEGEPRQSAHSG